MRTPTLALAATSLLLAAPQAHALDDPYMWGFGPRVGTIVIPGKYPVTFPDKVDNYNFKSDDVAGGSCTEGEFFDEQSGEDLCDKTSRDVADDGTPLYHSLKRVQGDLKLGGDFVFYLNKDVRVGATMDVAFGKQYFDVAVMPKVDKIILEDQVDVYAGGGIGFGYAKFAGAQGNEKLKMPYFPIRGELGAMVRAKTAAFQLGIYGQSSVPGNLTYVTADNVTHENVGTPLALFSYLNAGIEFTTYFGDFTPPKKKKKKKKRGGKKKGGKKGGGGGGGGGKQPTRR